MKGNNIKESAKQRLKTTGKNIALDALERAKEFAQKGSGRRKRKRVSPISIGSRKERKVHKKRKRQPSVKQLRALAKGRAKLKAAKKKKKRSRRKKVQSIF